MFKMIKTALVSMLRYRLKNWGRTAFGGVIALFFFLAWVGHIAHQEEDTAALSQKVAEEATKPLSDLREAIKNTRNTLHADPDQKAAPSKETIVSARKTISEADKGIGETHEGLIEVKRAMLLQLSSGYQEKLKGGVIKEADELLKTCRREVAGLRLDVLRGEFHWVIKELDDACDQLEKLAQGAPSSPKLAAEIKASRSHADLLAKEITDFYADLKEKAALYTDKERASFKDALSEAQMALTEHIWQLKLRVDAREGGLPAPDTNPPPEQ